MRARVTWLAVLVCLAGACRQAPAAEKAKKKGFFGVQIAAAEGGGVTVQAVFDDSPAAKGGLRPGDRLVSINGVRPATLKAAVDYIKSLKPGDKVKVVARRGGKEKQLLVVVGEFPE
jgi:S1-C subfamily serine protease